MGKTSVSVEDGNELKLVREFNDPPEQDAIRCVARERAVLVGTNERVRKIAEELVVVVELSPRARMNVADDQAGALVKVPSKHAQKFVVGLAPGIEQLQLR